MNQPENHWMKDPETDPAVRVEKLGDRTVYYIDVGDLPPEKTEQYMESIRQKFREQRDKNCPPNTSAGMYA